MGTEWVREWAPVATFKRKADVKFKGKHFKDSCGKERGEQLNLMAQMVSFPAEWLYEFPTFPMVRLLLQSLRTFKYILRWNPSTHWKMIQTALSSWNLVCDVNSRSSSPQSFGRNYWLPNTWSKFCYLTGSWQQTWKNGSKAKRLSGLFLVQFRMGVSNGLLLSLSLIHTDIDTYIGNSHTDTHKHIIWMYTITHIHDLLPAT